MSELKLRPPKAKSGHPTTAGSALAPGGPGGPVRIGSVSLRLVGEAEEDAEEVKG